MHQEIEAAVDFLLKVFSLKIIEPNLLDDLGKNLACLLIERYEGHWFPDEPSRGQAYRCIRINPWQYVDESLLQACTLCGIEYSRLPLPEEITLWIDPYEVCGRLGEDKDYFIIATFERIVNEEPGQVYARRHEEPVPFYAEHHEEPVQVYAERHEEPVQVYAERQTSDYSSEGPSSESVSENSSDDETSEEKLNKKVDVLLNCPTPDEAIDSPSTSNAGTPVSDLLASDDQKINPTDALRTQDTMHV